MSDVDAAVDAAIAAACRCGQAFCPVHQAVRGGIRWRSTPVTEMVPGVLRDQVVCEDADANQPAANYHEVIGLFSIRPDNPRRRCPVCRAER